MTWNFFAGEHFRDLDACRERAARWCREVAGLRAHGTTRLRPAEVFAGDEHPKLKPLPDTAFDIPTWAHPKVAPRRHVQIAKALYSVPGELVRQRLDARLDATTVKLYWRGELIKVHPVVTPGRRHTDPADLPSELTAYARRDLNALHRKISAHGEHVGAYTAAVLEHPLPWTKMRQVYRLLGLVRRHGAVGDACRRALDAEVVDVGVIDRMLTHGTTGQQLALLAPTPTPPPAPSRFVRATTDSPSGGHHEPAAARCGAGGQTDRGVRGAEVADAATQARPTPRHAPGAAGAGSSRTGCRTTTSWKCCSPTRSPAATGNPRNGGPRPRRGRETFLANALGHIAVRRHHTVHTERADKLFKRLRGARLDGSYQDEMRKLHRLETTETNDFYELIVERHRNASTVITNREPPEILTMMADPLPAQSAMDHLRSAAYELIVEGESGT